MKKFVAIYDAVEARVLIASLVVTVSLIFGQIVMRTVFNSSLSWSEELARYLFIWQTWLGISIGVRDGKHIRVEILFSWVKGKKAKLLHILASVLSVVFCVFLFWFGWKVMRNAYIKHSVSAAMLAPLWLVYLSLPFSCLVTGLRHLCQLWTQIRTFNE